MFLWVGKDKGVWITQILRFVCHRIIQSWFCVCAHFLGKDKGNLWVWSQLPCSFSVGFPLQKESSAFFYIILKMLENSFSISLDEWCFCAFLMVERCSCWWCGFYFSLTQFSIALKPPCLPTILELKLSYGVFLRDLFVFFFFLFLPSIFLLVESLLFFPDQLKVEALSVIGIDWMVCCPS